MSINFVRRAYMFDWKCTCVSHFNQINLWVAIVRHNFKWVKILKIFLSALRVTENLHKLLFKRRRCDCYNPGELFFNMVSGEQWFDEMACNKGTDCHNMEKMVSNEQFTKFRLRFSKSLWILSQEIMTEDRLWQASLASQIQFSGIPMISRRFFFAHRASVQPMMSRTSPIGRRLNWFCDAGIKQVGDKPILDVNEYYNVRFPSTLVVSNNLIEDKSDLNSVLYCFPERLQHGDRL